VTIRSRSETAFTNAVKCVVFHFSLAQTLCSEWGLGPTLISASAPPWCKQVLDLACKTVLVLCIMLLLTTVLKLNLKGPSNEKQLLRGPDLASGFLYDLV
jgi:hypothetical protein